MAKAVINLQKESGGIVKISPADGTGVTELVVPESGNLVSVNTAVTDNAIARYDGTAGKLQNSSVIVDDNGNVGIGGTPSAFGWYTTVSLDNASSGGIYNIKVKGTETARLQAYSGIFNVAAKGASTNLTFETNGAERMRLDTSGNLLLTSGTGVLGYGVEAGGTVTQLTSKITPVTLNKPCGSIVTSNSLLGAGEISSFYFYNNLYNSRHDILHIQSINNSNARLYDIWAVNNGPGYGFLIHIRNTSNFSLSDTLEINFAIIKGSNSYNE